MGSQRLWLATAGLAAYVVVAYQMAFFGRINLNIPSLWDTGEAQTLLLRGIVVAMVEETMFRGFLLFALARAWGDSRRGLLTALTIPALIFGNLF